MTRILPPLVVACLHLLGRSWRYRYIGRRHLRRCLADDRPVVAAFLHGRIFALLWRMSRPEHGRWISMCSKSLDGDAMARVEEALGLQVVRGSSGTDGLEALVEMIKRIKRDPRLGSCLAVDGSRGPRGQVQGGVVSLAAHTGGLILPLTASARPASILESTWDRTLLPWPFSRVVIAYAEPISVPKRPTAQQAESIRNELESTLIRLQAEADRESGKGDPEGVRAKDGPRG